jgi:hypothetical protein
MSCAAKVILHQDTPVQSKVGTGRSYIILIKLYAIEYVDEILHINKKG